MLESRRTILQFLIPGALAILLTGSAWAAVYEGTDVLGLATVADETGEFDLKPLALGPFDLPLLVYGYEHAQGIVGWECRVVVPDGVQLAGVSLNGKADATEIDLTGGNLRAFPVIPLEPVGGIVHLATLHLVLIDPSGDREFFLAAREPAASTSGLSFALETGEANVMDFHWPGDCPDCPVFRIIASPEPTVQATWDGIKSLYR